MENNNIGIEKIDGGLKDLNNYEYTACEVAGDVFRGNQRVLTYYDNKDNPGDRLDILQATNSPVSPLTTCATIGLVNNDTGVISGDGKHVRVELIGTVDSTEPYAVSQLGRILTHCSLLAKRKNNAICTPGSTISNAMVNFVPDSEMKHIGFALPIPFSNWGDKQLGVVDLDDKNMLTWLLAFPLSDAELEYVKKNGRQGMTDLVQKVMNEQGEKALFSYYRKSVL